MAIDIPKTTYNGKIKELKLGTDKNSSHHRR